MAAGAQVGTHHARCPRVRRRLPPPRLSPRAHCRSMRRSSALTGPRVRASQATDSGNICASTQRARAAVGRCRAIGSLGVHFAARCSSRPRRGTKVVTGGRWGGRRRLARGVASRPGGARAGQRCRISRAALCACCTHGPQHFVVRMSAAGQITKLGTREVLGMPLCARVFSFGIVCTTHELVVVQRSCRSQECILRNARSCLPDPRFDPFLIFALDFSHKVAPLTLPNDVS